MRHKVLCISTRPNSKQVTVDQIYYLDLATAYGDTDGDWYVDVYADEQCKMFIGSMKMSHFKSV
jgi:hypothetical protein